MSDWISVDERSPENEEVDIMGRVLVWNGLSGFSHLLHRDYINSELAYTHWQPLPEPPK